ncbi:MAG: rhodanese-like domain-containing protein [Bacteroidales bacterium]
MKNYIILVYFLLTGLNATAQVADSTRCKGASPEDFLGMIRMEKAVLIDVRMPFEHRREYIEGSVNHPAGRKLKRATRHIGRDSVILLYCTSGYRSCREASQLAAAGFTRVWSLEGGIRAWKEKGLPVKKK